MFWIQLLSACAPRDISSNSQLTRPNVKSDQTFPSVYAITGLEDPFPGSYIDHFTFNQIIDRRRHPSIQATVRTMQARRGMGAIIWTTRGRCMGGDCDLLFISKRPSVAFWGWPDNRVWFSLPSFILRFYSAAVADRVSATDRRPRPQCRTATADEDGHEQDTRQFVIVRTLQRSLRITKRRPDLMGRLNVDHGRLD